MSALLQPFKRCLLAAESEKRGAEIDVAGTVEDPWKAFTVRLLPIPSPRPS